MASQRLALGTAQFGMRYGVANRSGQIPDAEVRQILARARAAGIDTLDTAMAYGASESTLGSVGVADWSIVTKIAALPAEYPDAAVWVRDAVAGSLERLRVARLGAVLLHAPQQLLGPGGAAIYNALRQLREQGIVARIGVSVYGPDELEALSARYDFDLIQAPFNIVDRRLASSGWLRRLHDKGVAVHVRSLFLQGLLLLAAGERPPQFARWQSLWDRWQGWLESRELSAVEACVGFVLAQPGIERAVVGIDSLAQLEEILAVPLLATPEVPEDLALDDPELVDPSRWPLLGAA